MGKVKVPERMLISPMRRIQPRLTESKRFERRASNQQFA